MVNDTILSVVETSRWKCYDSKYGRHWVLQQD